MFRWLLLLLVPLVQGSFACAFGVLDSVRIFRLDYLDRPVRMDSLYCSQGVGRLQFFEEGVWKTTLLWRGNELGAALLWQLDGAQNSHRGSWMPLWQWPEILLRQAPFDSLSLNSWKSQAWGSGSPLLQVAWWDRTHFEHWFWDGDSLRQIALRTPRMWWLGNKSEDTWLQGRGSAPPVPVRSGGPSGLSVPLREFGSAGQNLLNRALSTAQMEQGALWASRAFLIWDQKGSWYLLSPFGDVQRGKCLGIKP